MAAAAAAARFREVAIERDLFDIIIVIVQSRESLSTDTRMDMSLRCVDNPVVEAVILACSLSFLASRQTLSLCYEYEIGIEENYLSRMTFCFGAAFC